MRVARDWLNRVMAGHGWLNTVKVGHDQVNEEHDLLNTGEAGHG